MTGGNAALRNAPRLAREEAAGFKTLEFYAGFDARVKRTKRKLLSFLIEAKEQGKKVVGYGAPGKGNTLLNFAGVRPDLLPYVVDKNPAKQGQYLPGSRIPIVDEAHLRAHRPDRVLILPWNIADEVVRQIRAAGGTAITVLPGSAEVTLGVVPTGQTKNTAAKTAVLRDKKLALPQAGSSTR